MLRSCARVTIGPWRWNSYFTCGFCGYLAGLALSMWLCGQAGLAAPARLAIAIAPPVVLLILIRLSTVITGRERIVFYESALVATVGTALVAALAGAPVLTALDVTMLGVGALLACGRVGCLRVGCCHGRPFRWGIVYGREHVAAGFDPRLRDVPVLPVQIADGLVAAALTAAGVAVFRSSAPGHATALWIAGYGVSRFGLELLRGDGRPCALGLSEAQWTAAVTACAAVALWPASPIIACASLVAAGAVGLLVARRRTWPHALWLGSPRHMRELDAVLASLAASGVAARTTTEGLRVSVHMLPDGTFDVVASHARRALDVTSARRIAAQLGARWQLLDAIAGRAPGLVHLILRQTL